MNKIFVSIIFICLGYGLITGRYEELASSILSLPDEALKLVCTLVFSATFWSGIMMIMYDSGLIDGLAKALDPLLSKIMPNLKDKEAKKYISSNIAANIFGLGFAATPGGATFRETEMLVCIFSLFDNNMKRWYNLLKGGDFF